jgi:hypothetical protein
MPTEKIDFAKNMRFWKEVCVTDPHHTKGVQKGRKFTAVDAQYQVQRATEIFGPVGEGWGYQVHYEFTTHDLAPPMEPFVTAYVTVWHGDVNNRFGPVCAIHPLVARYKSGAQFDDDAPKKAMTDALTKALSHLGFSADVFLGKYDDNKYVAQAQEFVEKQRVRRIEEYRSATASQAKEDAE